jgi:hypothetical protein
VFFFNPSNDDATFKIIIRSKFNNNLLQIYVPFVSVENIFWKIFFVFLMKPKIKVKQKLVSVWPKITFLVLQNNIYF